MPPTSVNSETILLSFLCGSLVLSFLFAVLGAVLRVYRPLGPVAERLRKVFAKDVLGSESEPMPIPTGAGSRPPPLPPPPQRVVELVDNGFSFQNRESLIRAKLAYPMPVAM